MRSPALLLIAPLLLVGALTGACSGGSEQSADDSSSVVIPDQRPGDSGSPAPDPGTGADPAPAPSACAEVVAGIAAFNAGDFEGTVQHFEAAVPLAEAEPEANPSAAADDLLESVRYYADLPPEDYPEASLTSPDFATYKAITLGQCASDGPPPSDDGGGVLA
ncbi:hypothetical protein BH11ACT8_BH11ACT8_12520 [soil metagenome]